MTKPERPDARRPRTLIGACSLPTLVGLAIVMPALGALVLLVLPIVRIIRQRRRAAVARDEIAAHLGEVVDLFSMALANGDTVALAVEKAARWAPPVIAEQFVWCLRQQGIGRSLAECLEQLPQRIDPALRPVCAALIANLRYGAPVAQQLAQLARDVRSDDRRRAEAAARRLPVVLLGPLVLCVLPAFLLLTVVPVVVETISSFDLLASLET